jgi:hypothetical protein
MATMVMKIRTKTRTVRSSLLCLFSQVVNVNDENNHRLVFLKLFQLPGT